MRIVLTTLALAALACRAPAVAPAPGSGGGVSAEDERMAEAAGRSGDGTAFGPLGVGADFASYRQVTAEPFLSRAHGDRWVHVYVNASAADAYVDPKAEVPDGTTVVKVSFLDDGGRPSQTPGPIYVMQKRAAGYLPEHGDWYMALHWAKPAGAAARGGPIYWQGTSPRLGFCFDCHDAYDRGLGGLIPSSLLPR